MNVEKNKQYPDCPVIIRTVEIAGLTKTELLQKLQENTILINKLGEKLFAANTFQVTDKKYTVHTVELKVRDLGFPEGATLPELYKKAAQFGLQVCPLELGPYLRLEYLDQPEGHEGRPIWRNRSPYGAVTIASEKVSEDIDFPRGFYLRKIEGALWLRGYTADDLYVCDPAESFIFCEKVSFI